MGPICCLHRDELVIKLALACDKGAVLEAEMEVVLMLELDGWRGGSAVEAMSG